MVAVVFGVSCMCFCAVVYVDKQCFSWPLYYVLHLNLYDCLIPYNYGVYVVLACYVMAIYATFAISLMSINCSQHNLMLNICLLL